MNLTTQMCGIVILSTLIIFFLLQKKIYLGAEKRFFAMLILMLCTHIFDILSLVAIYNSASIPRFLVIILCKAYLVCLLFVVISAFLYVNQDIFKKREEFLKRVEKQVLGVFATVIGVMVLPCDFVKEGEIIYTEGSAVLLTYISSLVIVLLVLIKLHKYRKMINTDRRKAVVIWMILWMLAAVIQYLKPSLLIVSFAGSVGMMILYIKLENPAISVDRQSGLFNQTVLNEYIRQKYESGKKFSMISFQLDNKANVRHGNRFNWENALESLSLKKGIMFRESKYEGAIVFKSEKDAREWENVAFEVLKNDNSENGMCLKRALWTSIYDSRKFDDVDELLNFYRYVANSNIIMTGENEIRHVVVDESIVAKLRSDKKMENLIDDAIAKDRVEVFYQPIFSTAEQKFTSAEALVRLRDEEGNIVPPGMFIPVAEKNGKIIALGNMVFEKVCRFISERHLEKVGVEYIEVNLSVVQCADEFLARNCIEMMKKYNVSPNRINLEITESAELKRKDVFMKNMDELRKYGISFSLDDFGTGHSNLNYIVDMAVDIVKFDRSMVNAFFSDEKARYVMEAAMQMIHGMGLSIVSEGIETKEQFNRIKEMGIAYIQGFYFSKPVPENEFYEFVSQNNCKMR